MFEDNHLADLPYPIAPNDVHLYEDQLQTNINVFSFFDEEGKARHPLFISRKQYPQDRKSAILGRALFPDYGY